MNPTAPTEGSTSQATRRVGYRDSYSGPARGLGELIVGVLREVPSEGKGIVAMVKGGVAWTGEAKLCASMTAGDRGRHVVIAFEEGNPLRPLVLGPLVNDETLQQTPLSIRFDEAVDRTSLECPGEEVLIRCGRASITLSRSGKIVIRGTSILTRSSGPNRIKGASVQIN